MKTTTSWEKNFTNWPLSNHNLLGFSSPKTTNLKTNTYQSKSKNLFSNIKRTHQRWNSATIRSLMTLTCILTVKLMRIEFDKLSSIKIKLIIVIPYFFSYYFFPLLINFIKMDQYHDDCILKRIWFRMSLFFIYRKYIKTKII
jgi:hypothetical protein